MVSTSPITTATGTATTSKSQLDLSLDLTSKRASQTAFLLRWGKLLGKTGGAQLIIQGTGFLCGIFIIHVLPTEEYAYYTLANTMLGTMTVLADGGIAMGVMSTGGKHWQDREELGSVLATGMYLRKRFAIVSMLISLPILFVLLHKQGIDWWYALAVIACLAPAFWASLSGSILQVVPKLHQDVNQLLKIDVGVNVSRLLLSLPLLFLFPFGALAILASGIPQVGGNIQLRKLAKTKATAAGEVKPVHRKQILKTVKRMLPGSVYYCISGQLTVWLVSIFNTTEAIAQIGALARLMMLLVLIRMVTEVLIYPRYARMPMVRKLVIRRFFQVLAMVIVICTSLVVAVYFFPEVFLFILGNKYQGLEQEVFLMSVARCLTMVSSIAYLMSSSRGIIPNPYLFIGTIVFSQVISLAFFVDYSTLSGVIYFSLITALVTVTYRIVHFLRETMIPRRWAKIAAGG